MDYSRQLKQSIKHRQLKQSQHLEIYFTNAVAIGEHPDLLAEVDKYLDMLEDAQGKLNALESHFSSKSESQLLQEQQGYSVNNGADANSERQPGE